MAQGYGKIQISRTDSVASWRHYFTFQNLHHWHNWSLQIMLFSWPITLFRCNHHIDQYSITVSATGNITILGPIHWNLSKDIFSETFAPVGDKYTTFSNISSGPWCTFIFPFDKNVSPVHEFATSLFYIPGRGLSSSSSCWVVNYTCAMKSKKWKKQWTNKASPFSWTANGITQNNIPLSTIISMLKVHRNGKQSGGGHKLHLSDAKKKAYYIQRQADAYGTKPWALSFRWTFLLSDKSFMCVQCVW
jgi:hypothetical protein